MARVSVDNELTVSVSSGARKKCSKPANDHHTHPKHLVRVLYARLNHLLCPRHISEYLEWIVSLQQARIGMRALITETREMEEHSYSRAEKRGCKDDSKIVAIHLAGCFVLYKLRKERETRVSTLGKR